MREKNLLQLFLILNVALGGAFVVYLLISSNHQPKVVSTTFPVPAVKTNAATNAASVLAPKTNATNVARTNAVVSVATNSLKTNLAGAVGTPRPALNNVKIPNATSKKFGWEQVDSDEYLIYIASLRAVGCPEEKVRSIVKADINELMSRKRLRAAVEHDTQWWRAEPDLMVVNVLQEKGRQLDEERRALIEKLLGPEAYDSEKGQALLWSNVQLTGPVLGNLPTEKHNAVQEICSRSIDRHQGAFWARINEGQPLNQVQMAQLRDQTRTDLRKILDQNEMEEFLLRYSHNAHQLRNELRGFDPSPEEFRKIFRAIDPIDHPLQLEYGGVETLSQQQRERVERQRDNAIKEALSPERYQQWLLTKDPLYRQAQMTAMQYGAPSKVIMPIYQMAKTSESKRQKILTDPSLTPEQKSQAINAVNIEQQQSVQRIVVEAAKQR